MLVGMVTCPSRRPLAGACSFSLLTGLPRLDYFGHMASWLFVRLLHPSGNRDLRDLSTHLRFGLNQKVAWVTWMSTKSPLLPVLTILGYLDIYYSGLPGRSETQKEFPLQRDFFGFRANQKNNIAARFQLKRAPKKSSAQLRLSLLASVGF